MIDLETFWSRERTFTAKQLAEAIEREVHLDPEHGFPAGFTAYDLARELIAQMALAAESE